MANKYNITHSECIMPLIGDGNRVRIEEFEGDKDSFQTLRSVKTTLSSDKDKVNPLRIALKMQPI